jgi:uncharacterized glyoxalase superfamily protein PhnB
MEDRPMLDQVNLVVQNMDAMVAFYQLLGVEVERPPAPWDAHHRSVRMPDGLDLDLDSSVFASQWNRGWPTGRAAPVLGFRVSRRETVDAIFARLTEAGYEGQQPPYDAFWGARYALVADPDGNTVGIMSEADAARRSQPTAPE